jgi:NADPH:quinone reductase-like Zn-dependent oxidoreductase
MGGSAVVDSEFLGKMLSKRVTLITSTLQSQTLEYKELIVKELKEDPDAFPAIASGDIQVQVDQVFLLDQVLQAHCRVHNHEANGKVVSLL